MSLRCPPYPGPLKIYRKRAPASIVVRPGFGIGWRIVGSASFTRLGPAEPEHPVVLSVPHAGRDYPLALRAAVRLPVAQLQVLEDRLIDHVAIAARRGETALVATRARAWIDLNRAEEERDPALDEGAAGPGDSHRLRSGLGLVPRRAGHAGEIWRRRLTGAEVERRIIEDHRPYHAELARLLAAARARFGVAVLIDVHSMPPLGGGARAPQMVLGDRFGRTADARLAARLEAEGAAAGMIVATNSPYAGGHVITHHASPEAGIHALQVEFDRRLYLDSRMERAGAGLGATARLLRRLIDAAVDAVMPQALAAE